MNLLDLFIIVVAVAAAVGGYRLGFVARALSWLGLALGLFIAARLLPAIIRSIRTSNTVPGQLLLLAVVLLVVGAFIGQVLGLIAGSRLHLAIRSHSALQVDRVAGAAAGLLGVLVAVWFLTPAMASVPGWPARSARTSAIAREVERLFPGAPDTAQALRRLVGSHYPEVFDALDPAPDLGNPPAASGLDAATASRISQSTVKVEGQACDMIQAGSGFVVGGDLVATNAHVVAGEHQIEVWRTDGTELDATPVAFDPNRDLAVLAVPGLDRPALPLVDPDVGDRGGVFGHPGGGPLTVSPFQIGREEQVVGNDIYDSHRTDRKVLFLASDLAPGDSGGALVTPQGQVVGVAFAIAPDRPGVAYALDPADVRQVVATAQAGAVSTGGCVSD